MKIIKFYKNFIKNLDPTSNKIKSILNDGSNIGLQQNIE
jgi:hypothetical protein